MVSRPGRGRTVRRDGAYAAPEPRWHENVLGTRTGLHTDEPEYGRLTIARIDSKEIETWSFAR